MKHIVKGILHDVFPLLHLTIRNNVQISVTVVELSHD